MRFAYSHYQCRFRRDAHTNIGDSEYSGGETTYCTSAGPGQGTLPDNFWMNVEYKTDNGANGNRYVQRMCGGLR